MDKWIKEIERVKNDQDAFLDRECIGVNSVTVLFLDTKERYNLSDSYFSDRHSVLDPCWAGAYIRPGEITSLREIHINAVRCDLVSHLLERYLEYKTIFGDREYYEQFIPEFVKEVRL